MLILNERRGVLAVKTDILFIEDSLALAQAYQEYVRNEPWVVEHVDSGAQALEYIYAHKPKVIVLDLMLPDMNGMDILRAVHQDQLNIAVIVVTGTGTYAEAKAALAMGAKDFLEKPVSSDRFVTTIRNVLEHAELEDIVEEIETHKRGDFQGFIGSSAPMQLVYQTIEQVASSNVPVFISGESGTGKEVCARAIHEESERQGKPFIALNCAAIPRDLVESEIFGHMKGAFTGAVKNRDGAATQANSGTLFLDEIAEMDIDLQAKLLRFIQTQTFQRVGASKSEKVDVRFLCATNRNIFSEVEKGNFREDLYYRLNVIGIEMPALRRRRNDVLEITQYFLQQFAKEESKNITKFSSKALDELKRHSWPGNVRELQNVIRRAVVMHQGDSTELEITDIPHADNNGLAKQTVENQLVQPEVMSKGDMRASNQELLATIKPLAQVEREAIEQAIELCGNNIPKAAAMLDVSPSTIYRKIQQW